MFMFLSVFLCFYLFFLRPHASCDKAKSLVEEVPAETKAEGCRIHWVTRCPEVATIALVGVIVVEVEACALQGEVGIYAHERVVAYLDFVAFALCREHTDDW